PSGEQQHWRRPLRSPPYSPTAERRAAAAAAETLALAPLQPYSRAPSGEQQQHQRRPLRSPPYGPTAENSTLRMNTVLSTSEASDSGSKVILKTGVGSTEFVSKKTQIKAAFQARKSCWNLVDPSLVAAAAVGADPLETTFTEPAIDVEARLVQDKTAKVLAINALFNPRFTAINAQTHPNAGERASAKAVVREKQNGFIDAVELNDASMRSGLQALKKARDDREKEHKDMVEACIACFNEIFAPGVLTAYLEDVTNKLFRKAWCNMCRDMDGVMGGASTGSTLQFELLQFRYNNAFTMDQNVQYLETLRNQLTSLGLIQSDGTMNVTLINGIVKSAAHYKLKSQAEYEERQKTGTYESTKLALKIKYTQLVDSNEITAGGKHGKWMCKQKDRSGADTTDNDLGGSFAQSNPRGQ
ncbi:hypothetical protein B484DRAFT_399375, partial [Ochromonadaceae sp. CCMP2298]